jgi:hypothetical protein
MPASASTTSATNAENIAEQIFRYMPMRLPSLNGRYPAVSEKSTTPHDQTSALRSALSLLSNVVISAGF